MRDHEAKLLWKPGMEVTRTLTSEPVATGLDVAAGYR